MREKKWREVLVRKRGETKPFVMTYFSTTQDAAEQIARLRGYRVVRRE